MDNIVERERVGAYWFGKGWHGWDKASPDEQAVVLAQMRTKASTPADSPAKALARTIADSVRAFVARALVLRDARLDDLEDRVRALEGDGKGIAKPRVKLKVAGRE